MLMHCTNMKNWPLLAIVTESSHEAIIPEKPQ